MKGSLPRDPVNLIRFCDEYDVDIYWWVNGEIRPRMSLDVEKLVRAGRKVDLFAEEHDLTLTNEQRTLLMGNVYKKIQKKLRKHLQPWRDFSSSQRKPVALLYTISVK